MVTKPSVLILGEESDGTAAAVNRSLTSNGFSVARFDLSEFPRKWAFTSFLTETSWKSSIHHEVDKIDLSEVRGVYVRRPGKFKFPDSITGAALDFSRVEAQSGVLGTLMAQMQLNWVNHPMREHFANYKPAQISLAEGLGLMPPKSLITNRRSDVVTFSAKLSNPLLYKEMGRYLSEDPTSLPMPKVREVSLEDLNDSISYTACLFQERLPKQYDVRLIVAGVHQVAIAILGPAGQIDWRTDLTRLTYEQIDIPATVSRRIDTMMDRLGLLYGAFDFVVTHDDAWRFIELNPNGQWRWLQQYLETDIAALIATVLTS